MNLHFIHGFLGHPDDWKIFENDFPDHSLHFHSIESFLPKNTNQNKKNSAFESWAKNFNSSVFQNSKSSPHKNILIGYSLGGRLALHCLKESVLWDGAIIISANPGLTNSDLKQQRLENDQKWANRFLKDDWEKTIQDWNSQGVFSNKANLLLRHEKDYNKEIIADILLSFSLGKQEDLRNFIKELKMPTFWITGEEDAKFTAIAKEISSRGRKLSSRGLNTGTTKFLIIPNAGHRVPWENSEKFKQQIFDLIATVNER